MTINKKIENNSAILFVEGWLDTQSSPELGNEIDSLSNIYNLVLDFENLEYISSSGLRQVISAYKKITNNGGTFSIINVRSEVMDIFSLTGLDKKLDISTK